VIAPTFPVVPNIFPAPAAKVEAVIAVLTGIHSGVEIPIPILVVAHEVAQTY